MPFTLRKAKHCIEKLLISSSLDAIPIVGINDFRWRSYMVSIKFTYM